MSGATNAHPTVGRPRPGAARVAVGLAAVGLAAVVWTTVVLLVLGAAAAGLAGWAGWCQRDPVRLRRRAGTEGWLGPRDLLVTAGARAVCRRAGVPGWTQLRPPVAQAGMAVGRVVTGPVWMWRRRVYSPWSQGVLVLGPPGSGKSTLLNGVICQAPGAAYVTSTKTEPYDRTADIRAQVGDVHVFNPTELGGLASTFRWDPVADCTDPEIADARARALVRGGGGATGTQNAEFWAGKAAEILRCYLLAAALTGRDMGQVMTWAQQPDSGEPTAILAQRDRAVPEGWRGLLEANLAATANTRTGYFASLLPAVAFMGHAEVARACRPSAGHGLDLTRFLQASNTLYVVAGDNEQIAPLITALTEAVFAAAKRLAATRPGGRLDPGLGLFLDEIANITPVPLETWAADSRGWGITVCAAAQDLAQLETRWGRPKARTIFSNLPTRIVLPGVAQKDDLEELSYLGGQRWARQTSESHAATDGGRPRLTRSRSWTREPVAPGHLIHALPRWHAYVLGVASKPVIVRFHPGYRGRGSAAAGRVGATDTPRVVELAPPPDETGTDYGPSQAA